MKIGICVGEDIFKLAKDNGFAFAEPSIQLFRNLDKTRLSEVKKKTEDSGITVDGYNGFFGPDVSLYRDTFESLTDYSLRNLEICAYFNSSYFVIGSGRARSFTEDTDIEKAKERFMKLVDWIGTKAKEYNTEIYIEPLNYNETNYINTLKEGVEFCRSLNNSNVGALVDLFHFYKNGESLDDFDILKPGELKHVHIARPDPDRDAPIRADEKAVSIWANRLKQIGYDGRVALECLWKYGYEHSIKEAGEVMGIFCGE